jgi:ABC-type branched-subunit amino acid transport system substrate-binding protein
MSDCLHCDINVLIQKHLEPADAELGDVVARISESLVDTILLAPDDERANLLAEAMAALGQLYLEKSGAIEAESSARH